MFRTHKNNPYVSLFAGVLVLGMAAWTTYETLLNYSRQQAAATRYERISARVVQSKVKETVTHSRHSTRTHYSPDIEYRYEVAGVPYIGEKYCFYGQKCNNRADAKQIVNRFGPGRHVTAYYDPNSPTLAVLSNTAPTFQQSDGIIMAMMWIGSFLLILFSLWKILPKRGSAAPIAKSFSPELADDRFYNPTMTSAG